MNKGLLQFCASPIVKSIIVGFITIHSALQYYSPEKDSRSEADGSTFFMALRSSSNGTHHSGILPSQERPALTRISSAARSKENEITCLVFERHQLK